MKRVLTGMLTAVLTGGLITGAGLLQHAAATAHHSGSNSRDANDDSQSLTIRFLAKEITRNVQVDIGAPGPSVGDSVIEHETLVRNGHRIGHDTLQCTAIRLAPRPDFQCLGTLVFADGEVTIQAATDFSEIRAAVTGGTQRYLGAYGDLQVQGTATTTDRDVLRLILPED